MPWETVMVSAHKKFDVLNGTGRFVAAFTTARHDTSRWHEPVAVSTGRPVVYSFVINVCLSAWRGVAWRACCVQAWKVALNVFNKQSRTAEERWSSSIGVAGVANSLRSHVIRMLRG